MKILFEVVCPTDAFFGQKDYQQTLLVKWLINKCKFKIRLHVCPIVRTSDGLALSSRNLYLNPKERKNALILRQTLHLAQSLIQKGENDVLKIENAMRKYIAKEKTVVLDYAVIRNQNDLSQQKNINQTSIALIVVKFGMTRLLDNMLLKT